MYKICLNILPERLNVLKLSTKKRILTTLMLATIKHLTHHGPFYDFISAMIAAVDTIAAWIAVNISSDF